MPTLPAFHKLLMTAEKLAMRGVRLRDRQGRRTAKLAARVQADTWASDLLTIATTEVRTRQHQIDAHWQALHANDPETVFGTLDSEFSRLGRSIRVTQVVDGDVGLVTTMPASQIVPAAKPAVTPSGAPTLHKINKTEHAEWYAQVIAAYVLLAAKEAFALAPGLTAARVVAVDAQGAPIVAARISRDRLARVDWGAGAWPILHWLDGSMRCNVAGRTRELRTLDLRGDEVFGSLLA